MADNELVYIIWEINPLKEQFEIAPYSLISDDIILIQTMNFSRLNA